MGFSNVSVTAKDKITKRKAIGSLFMFLEGGKIKCTVFFEILL